MVRAFAFVGLFALAAAGRGTTAYPPMNEWQEAAMAAQRAATASVVETINQAENYSSSSSIPMTSGFRMMGTSSSGPNTTQQNAVQEALLDSVMHEVQTIFKNTLTVPGWENMDAAAETVKHIVDRVRERLNMSVSDNETGGRGMTTAAALRGVTNDFLKEIMVQEAVIETLWAVLRDSQARPWITNEQQAMHVAATQAVHGFLTRMQERLRATGFTEEEITKMLPRSKNCNKDAPQGAPDSCAPPMRNLFSRAYGYGYYPSYYSSYGYYPSYYSYGYYPRAYSYAYPSYYSYSYPSYYSYSYPSYYSYGYPAYRSYGYYPSYYYRRLGEMMMGPAADQYPIMNSPMGAAAAPPRILPIPALPVAPLPGPMGMGMMDRDMGMGMGMGMRRAAAMAPLVPSPMMMGPLGFNKNSSSSRLLEPLNEYESEPERALGKKYRGYYGGGCGYGGYGGCGYGGYGYGYPMIVSYGYHGFGGCGGGYGGYGGYGYYPHSYGYGGCGGHFRRLEVPDLHTTSSTSSNIPSTIKTENTMGFAPNTTFRRVGETRSTISTSGRGSFGSSGSSESSESHFYPEHSNEASWEAYN